MRLLQIVLAISVVFSLTAPLEGATPVGRTRGTATGDNDDPIINEPSVIRIPGTINIRGHHFGTKKGLVELAFDEVSFPTKVTKWQDDQISVNVPQKLKPMFQRVRTGHLVVKTRHGSGSRQVRIEPPHHRVVWDSTAPESIRPRDTIVIVGSSYGNERGTVTVKQGPYRFESFPAQIIKWKDHYIEIGLPPNLGGSNGLQRKSEQTINLVVKTKDGKTYTTSLKYLPEDAYDLMLFSRYKPGTGPIPFTDVNEIWNGNFEKPWQVIGSYDHFVRHEGQQIDIYHYNRKARTPAQLYRAYAYRRDANNCPLAFIVSVATKGVKGTTPDFRRVGR